VAEQPSQVRPDSAGRPDRHYEETDWALAVDQVREESYGSDLLDTDG
jgi:hypothetical protein